MDDHQQVNDLVAIGVVFAPVDRVIAVISGGDGIHRIQNKADVIGVTVIAHDQAIAFIILGIQGVAVVFVGARQSQRIMQKTAAGLIRAVRHLGQVVVERVARQIDAAQVRPDDTIAGIRPGLEEG